MLEQDACAALRSRLFRRFRDGNAGGAALIFGLALPVLLGSVGVAVDYASWISQRANLQKVADTAAFATTRELQIGANEARIASIAESIVRSQIKLAPGDSAVTVNAALVRQSTGATTASANAQSGPYSGVKVTLWQRKNAIMSRIVTPELTDMEVSATAQMAGGTKICVIGLDETAADTIRLDNKAQLSASGCSVHINSTSPQAVRSEESAVLRSLRTCSSGGFKGGVGNFAPRPSTDCPKTKDPLADRPSPPFGPCTYTKLVIGEGKTRTLDPGTYCGGLLIKEEATVTLRPGIYVMKDGPLIVDEEARLRGDYVGFYFTGTDARFLFDEDSNVELTAPKDGPLAGLLFFEDRASPALRPFEVLSRNARKLVGTIYIPKGRFVVNANQTVADQSAYTAIVTRRLELRKAPNLVLNTNYYQSDVPVPEGLGPSSGQVRLVQ